MTKPERMTNEMLEHVYTEGDDAAVYDEAVRARASEEEKDKVIQALADALMTASPRRLQDGSPCWCFGLPPHDDACESRRAAIRAAGRLK